MSSVRLIGITKPVNCGCETANELVAYAARVSNPANQNNASTAGKLVKYLIKNDHWSPLEMVHVVMEIKTTRDISRQIIRHRSFSFQEFSQRYAVSENFTKREARLQDLKNRQNSLVVHDFELQREWEAHQEYVIEEALAAYEWALENNIAKEQARAVLPEGLTETTLYMSGTLRSWVHYCQLRMGNGTQLEHSQIAQMAWEIIKKEFPDVAEALDDNS
jgi:thymidylate synthase (FAD)